LSEGKGHFIHVFFMKTYLPFSPMFGIFFKISSTF